MNVTDRKIAVSIAPAMAAAAQAQATADTAMSALGSQAIRQINVTTPLLPIGTTNIPITWPTPMPDTDYSVVVAVDSAPAVLGRITASAVQGTKTLAGFTLAVTATGVLPIAIGQGVLNCIGIRLANPV